MSHRFDAGQYPDVAEHGSLAAALNARMAAAGSPHRFVSPQTPTGLVEAVVSEGGEGGAGVFVNTGVDGYAVRFSRQNWVWAVGATPDKHRIVGAALSWLGGTGLAQLASDWDFIKVTELQLSYERGDAVETQWEILLRDEESNYRDLVVSASLNPDVRRHFPVLGHNFLLMESEFSSDFLASVLRVGPGKYRLYVPEADEPLLQGGGDEVVARLARRLGSQGSATA
ncbi:hypothetical protein ACFWBF_32600 [Streptomyces sp. NPDC060028]|uniref:hypothetical protein n=1 Tax=Streptomyces sp. NPDC060028 TaxID=3347041 RepID=UPI0036BA59BC